MIVDDDGPKLTVELPSPLLREFARSREVVRAARAFVEQSWLLPSGDTPAGPPDAFRELVEALERCP